MVSRWKAGSVRPQAGVQPLLSDLHGVVDRLSEFYEPREVRAWLYAPHPQLDSRRAIDLIAENRSAVVLQILDRLGSGAHL